MDILDPPIWPAPFYEWAPTLVGLLLLTTFLVHIVLRPLSRRLEAAAIASRAKWDDEPARKLRVFFDGLAHVLDLIAAVLPRLAVGRPSSSSEQPPAPPDPPRRGTIDPPRRGTLRVFDVLALACLIGALGALASVCTGCGPYDAHAGAALALRDSSNAAKRMILDAREQHLREAAEAAQTSGGDVGAAIEAAGTEWDAQHASLYDAQGAFAEASTTYTTSALAAVTGQRSGETIEQAGRAAARALNRVIAELRRHGLPDLPDIPEAAGAFLAGLIGGAL